MTAVAAKTVLTGCLAPIDKGGLDQLIANGKANSQRQHEGCSFHGSTVT
ncbi:MAG: OsmC family peroxiredoxin [Tardiphaga sp.]|nr:OsmC family peroxiredoxin [Tardiphaga sp.]